MQGSDKARRSRCVAVVLVFAFAGWVVGCGTSAQSSTTTVGATEVAGAIDPRLCALLKEQAEGALALGPDPEEAFRIRDLIDRAGIAGGFTPANAFDFLPQEVVDDQGAIEDEVNDILPSLDMAQLSKGDPSADLKTFHSGIDETAARMVSFVDTSCPVGAG